MAPEITPNDRDADGEMEEGEGQRETDKPTDRLPSDGALVRLMSE